MNTTAASGYSSTLTPIATHAQRRFCCRCVNRVDTYATVAMTWADGARNVFHFCTAHVDQAAELL